MGNTNKAARARATKGGAVLPTMVTPSSKEKAIASESLTIPSEVIAVSLEGGPAASEVVTVASGADAYTINITSENRLGGGNYADVYKIEKKDT
jgi:hypothetical protein